MMQIVYRKTSELIPYDKNPRNNLPALDATAASIQAFGFLVPIIIDEHDVIVAGHTRLMAAQKLGLEEVPTVQAEGLTEEQIRMYRLVDNKVAELAVWDMPLLDERIQDVGDEFNMVDFGFNFDLGSFLEPKETSKEFDPEEFSDEQFEYECPDCGFRFNQ
jgi:hypothetical protein